ncbi:GAF and ANTAR domain-containing protein [Streptomyces sp. MS2.AVA.5]|uniref:GAF and ANTAR domain-containing protein n=1 Tax=Streptomyces achmelvichensis TaxID=3134111 RepID=A0ACC6PYW4_9ACTN
MKPPSRASRIRLLVAEQAALRGARVGVVDVCNAAAAALPFDGAGVSAMFRTAASHPLCSTDDISEQLEELQLTLGEGPCVDAFALGSVITAPDLQTAETHSRWPAFAEAAIDAGAGAVCAFPLQVGAIMPGVLDLYSTGPVELDQEQLADACAFADTATLVLLDARIEQPVLPLGIATEIAPDRRLEDLGGYRAEIDQATGMLTVQLGVGIEEAFIRLRAHAYARGQRLAEVASDIVARRLRLPPGPDTDESDEPSD